MPILVAKVSERKKQTNKQNILASNFSEQVVNLATSEVQKS